VTPARVANCCARYEASLLFILGLPFENQSKP
jgi:hypothetical protein